MKKAAQICLLIIYTAAALGISVKGLYCCDKLRAVTVSIAGTQQENKEGQDANCFKTKYQVLLLKDNHYAPGVVKAPQSFYTAAIALFYEGLQVVQPQTSIPPAYKSHPPPLRGRVPVYLYDGVFRI